MRVDGGQSKNQLKRRKDMTQENSIANPMHRAMTNALGIHWRLFLVQGIVTIFLGALAVALPVAATIAVDIFVGWLFLIAGAVGLVAMFSSKNVPAFLWTLVTAALSLVAGVVLIWRPLEGALTLTMILAALFLVEGIFQIVTSLAYRDVIRRSWGWMLASGICDVVLVAVIVFGWPMAATWWLGLLVGVNLITSGGAIVMVAVAGRDIIRVIEGRRGPFSAAIAHHLIREWAAPKI
jgi:uncharacterized membrane protein HdeD (DUF308 family)